MLGKLVLAVVGAFVFHRVFEIVKFQGYHKVVFKHRPGPCRSIPDIVHGAEDMDYLPGDKVLMTTGLRLFGRHNENFKDVVTGVYLFDFNNPDKGVEPVTIKGFKDLKDCDFHGMSIWTDKKSGKIKVFIVNHLETESVVEIFDYNQERNELNYLETTGHGDPVFKVLNDVVAVGPRQYYVTVFMYTRSELEAMLYMKWGYVVYYDGKKGYVVTDERFLHANGINKSPDGKYIYMNHIADREMLTYTIKPDNSLELFERTPLYSLVDNILVDQETGDIWIGSHVAAHRVAVYVNNPRELSPSQVLLLRVQDGHVTDITEVLMDDGRLISGAAVAVYKKNQLLVGTVHSTLLHCDVKYIRD